MYNVVVVRLNQCWILDIIAPGSHHYRQIGDSYNLAVNQRIQERRDDITANQRIADDITATTN